MLERVPFFRGGRKTGQVAERIDFTIIPPYFMHEKAKSGFKTILSAMELGQTGDTSGDIHITAKYMLVEKIPCGYGLIKKSYFLRFLFIEEIINWDG